MRVRWLNEPWCQWDRSPKSSDCLEQCSWQSNHGKFATVRANGNGSVVKRGENVHQYVAAAKDRAGCNQSNGD